MLKEEILAYVKKEYGAALEYLWKSYPECGVLRHKAQPGGKKAKWYAMLMNVKREALGLKGRGCIDILNVKCEPEMLQQLCHVKGYLPGYHMNKANWLSILLDGTVPLDNIKQLIDGSYGLTASPKEKKKKARGPRDWIIPANPRFFDVIQEFEDNEIIDWSQSSNVHVGDILYMYVAAPYSAIMYKCKAVEVDIPYDYEDDNLKIKKIMRIRLLNKYTADFMPLERMKREFGVSAVRGPRGIPYSLKEEINAYERIANNK